MQKNNGFPKAEKLKKSSEIDLLFKKGKTKSSGDLRIVYMKIPEENLRAKPRVGVSVSKKNFKRAVDRNRIKRLLRESYRLNKENFAKAFGSGISAMIIWKSSCMPHGLQETERIFLELCTNEKINTQNL